MHNQHGLGLAGKNEGWFRWRSERARERGSRNRREGVKTMRTYHYHNTGSCHYFRVDALIITAGRCNLISDCHPSLAGPLCPLLPHLLLRLAATTAGKPLVSVARCGHWQKTVVVVVEQSAAEDGRGVVFGRTTGREVWRRKKSGVGEGRRRAVGRGGGG